MKFRKTFVSTIVALVLVVGLAGFSETHAKKQNKYVWKFACLGQKSLPMIRELFDKIQELFYKSSNNELDLIIYWGGSMGDEEDYVAKMRIEQLQGALITASASTTSTICPTLAVLGLPFLFNDENEVNYIINRIREQIIKDGEKNGFKILGIAQAGFDQFYSTKYPMTSLEHFKKAKVLTWFGPLEDRMLRALGSSPIPVNVPEVVTSMRSGVCNVAISPSLWWVGSQLYTITKYVNPMLIRVLPGVVVVSMKAWNGIPHSYGDKIMRNMPEVMTFLNKGVKKLNQDCYTAMLKYGLKEVKMSSEEVNVFKKRTRPVWDELAGEVFSEELLKEVLVYLKEYRANKGEKEVRKRG